jgi:hypothetical protein
MDTMKRKQFAAPNHIISTTLNILFFLKSQLTMNTTQPIDWICPGCSSRCTHPSSKGRHMKRCPYFQKLFQERIHAFIPPRTTTQVIVGSDDLIRRFDDELLRFAGGDQQATELLGRYLTSPKGVRRFREIVEMMKRGELRNNSKVPTFKVPDQPARPATFMKNVIIPKPPGAM